MATRARRSGPTDELVEYVMGRLEARRDPVKAAGVTAYMKIEQRGDPSPPMGATKDVLDQLCRELRVRFRPADEAALLAQMTGLWAPPWREPKYVALAHARAFEKKLLSPKAVPTLERMITSGAWWDLVDPIASWLVSPLYLRRRAELRPALDRWRASPDLWLRRAVLLAHLKHKAGTDAPALFADITALAHEREFFIRKAIGWVLRDYSYAAPDAVKAFLVGHRAQLSGLSYREGARHLVKLGELTV